MMKTKDIMAAVSKSQAEAFIVLVKTTVHTYQIKNHTIKIAVPVMLALESIGVNAGVSEQTACSVIGAMERKSGLSF